jgi:outer membrane protein
MRHRSALAIAASLGLTAGAAHAGTRTLQEALALAYSNNPSLQAARAQLRSVDENVPAALAGWRPTVTVTGSAGYVKGTTRTYVPCGVLVTPQCGGIYTKADRDIGSAQAQLTQPLYSGGATRAGTNRAVNQVMAQRARLIAQEETVFSDTVNAYVNVIATQQVLALDINNEQVLAEQLRATNDRFRVGEITRTDVAQAEAALAGATATRQTAEGNV